MAMVPLATCPQGVPAPRARVPEPPDLCTVSQLTGPLLRLVCRRGAVSAGDLEACGPTREPGAEVAGLRLPSPHRCTRRAECPRAEESGHWLWSRNKSCVSVTGAQPQNMSRRAQGEVRSGGQDCWPGAVGMGRTTGTLDAEPEDRSVSFVGLGPPAPVTLGGSSVSMADRASSQELVRWLPKGLFQMKSSSSRGFSKGLGCA